MCKGLPNHDWGWGSRRRGLIWGRGLCVEEEESDLGSGWPHSSRRFSPSVPQLRTQDLSYFREMPRAQGYLARIRPVQPTHGGTFSCVITHDQRPLARLYFFLNGLGGLRGGRGCAGAGFASR